MKQLAKQANTTRKAVLDAAKRRLGAGEGASDREGLHAWVELEFAERLAQGMAAQ